MVLERINEVIKAFPKENWKKAKYPYCFGDIKKYGNWPHFWNECKKCGMKINFFLILMQLKKL